LQKRRSVIFISIIRHDPLLHVNKLICRKVVINNEQNVFTYRDHRVQAPKNANILKNWEKSQTKAALIEKVTRSTYQAQKFENSKHNK